MVISEPELFGALKLLTAATSLPVTLQELRDEIGIGEDDDSIDFRLTLLLQAATARVEKDSRLVLMPQTWQWHSDCFPCEIELRIVPVASVTHIKYLVSGVQTTLLASRYQVDLITHPSRIRMDYGDVWPTTDYGTMNSVEVQFVAGFASASAVPPMAKMAVLLAAMSAFHGRDVSCNYWTYIASLKEFGHMR